MPYFSEINTVIFTTTLCHCQFLRLNSLLPLITSIWAITLSICLWAQSGNGNFVKQLKMIKYQIVPMNIVRIHYLPEKSWKKLNMQRQRG